MAASDRTIEEVAKVILRHISPAVAEDIVRDLESIPGNQSFRDTIKRLADLLRGKNGKQ